MDLLELTVESGASFAVRRFAVREGISTPFSIELEVHSPDDAIDLDSIADRPATFKIIPDPIENNVKAPRIWEGVCTQILQTDAILRNDAGARAAYLVKIGPRLWLTTLRTGCRMFQHQSIPDILEKVLGEWKVQFEKKLTKQYKKLEYCVQYAESDYRFLSRLMERAGISYFFDDGKMVLSDAPQLADPTGPIPFHDSPTVDRENPYITSVQVGRQLRPGKFTIADKDFRRATKTLYTGKSNVAPGHESELEQYHFSPGVSLVEPGSGGESTPVADADGIARYEQEILSGEAQIGFASARARKIRVGFRTSVMDLRPGKVFTIKDHPHADVAKDKRLLVTEFAMDGTISTGDYVFSGESVAAGPDQPYAPEMLTPLPKIYGVESAIVVGEGEVDPDEFGRVRVQFHWDRDHSRERNSSCWIRVSQAWAGPQYGTMMIPRVGHEVLVAFFEGDPDQPVIVGRVYNGKNSVPYKLPENQTVSTWKSDSSPGNNGYNEILIEDQKDAEYMYVQAERDMQRLVKRNEAERTGKHRQIFVGQDQRTIVAKTEATLVVEKYQVQMMTEPGEGKMAILPQTKPSVEPEPTKIEMMDKKLMSTSGKATVLMKKDTITFDVKGNINILSKGGDVVFETPSKVIKINC